MTAVLDAHRIAHRLWQGSYPGGLEHLVGRHFQVIALCARGLQPPDQWFPGARVVRAALHDEDPIVDGDVACAWAAAREVVALHRRGARVLVTCAAGRNRSGLVSAMVLHLLSGMSGTECAAAVARARPLALTNEAFCRYLARVPASGVGARR